MGLRISRVWSASFSTTNWMHDDDVTSPLWVSFLICKMKVFYYKMISTSMFLLLSLSDPGICAAWYRFVTWVLLGGGLEVIGHTR